MKNATRTQTTMATFFVVFSLLSFQLSTFAQAQKVKLEEGNQVRLRLMESLSSATAQVGQTVAFEVLDPITVEGTVVVAEGAPAWATIIEAANKKSFGRAGKLTFRLDYVKAVDGSKIPLRASSVNKGEGRGATSTAIITASALFFLPAAPIGMMIKGKNVDIPRGHHIQAFTDGDRWIETRPELSRNVAWGQVHGTKIQQAVGTPNEQNSGTPVNNRTNVHYASLNNNQPVAERTMSGGDLGTVNVIAEQIGAEIEVDGTSYGNTPAVLKLPAGLHAVTVKAPGLPAWQRNINVVPGSSLTFRVNFEQGQNRLVKNEQ
jgi:hypothetical protein